MNGGKLPVIYGNCNIANLTSNFRTLVVGVVLVVVAQVDQNPHFNPIPWRGVACYK